MWEGPILGIDLLGRFARSVKSYGFYAVVIIALLVTAALAYSVMYGIRSVNWNGIDELGFNYYAAYLFRGWHQSIQRQHGPDTGAARHIELTYS